MHFNLKSSDIEIKNTYTKSNKANTATLNLHNHHWDTWSVFYTQATIAAYSPC